MMTDWTVVGFTGHGKLDDPATTTRAMNPESASHEQVLTNKLAAVGPVIAIGRPGEKLSTLGAARLYIGDDEWQETVSELVDRAVLIVLRIGGTGGLFWEVERLAHKVDPKRVLFYEPRAFSVNVEDAYESFKKAADKILPHPLPDNLGTAKFIAFDENWQPASYKNLNRLLDKQGIPRKRRPLWRYAIDAVLVVLGATAIFLLMLFLSKLSG